MLSYEFIRSFARKRLIVSRIILLVVLLEFLFSDRISHINQDSKTYLFIGTILVIGGTIIRSWAAGVLQKRDKLVQVGPYSLCRNPLYLGSFIIASGFGMLLNDPWYWVGLLFLFLVIYPFTVKLEEIELQKLYPKEWAHYVSNVGLLFPRQIKLAKILHYWSCWQWIKNKEYNATVTTIIALTLILTTRLL